MSKSPKHLLPSSLSLSSLSRALPTSPSTKPTYSIRTLASQPQRERQRGGGLYAVRQRTAAGSSTSSTSGSRRVSGTASPPQGQHNHGGQTASTSRGTGQESQLLARRNSSNGGGRTFLGSFADSRSASRRQQQQSSSFHSTSHHSHQQPAVSSSSPPPGAPLPSSSSSSSSHHSPKPTSTRTAPGSDSHDGADSSSYYISPQTNRPTATSDHPPVVSQPTQTSSSSSASSSSSSSSLTAPPAALFSVPTPLSAPPHALPSFFGSALSIARRSNLVFRNGAYGIPKPTGGRYGPEKTGKGRAELEREDIEHPLSVGVGEDSYFLRSDSLGVADGVGGWSGHAGANSARWARKFMHHCSSELSRYEDVEDELFIQYYEVDPVEVMQRAFEKTLAECKEEGTIGSSTALLAVLRNDELRLANLGDCSCCIIRDSSYLFRTEEQQHQFNFPFQAGTNAKDTPAKDAQRFTVKVKRDDIVILASDGLVDNVFSDDLLEEVLHFVSSIPSPPAARSSSSSPPKLGLTLRRFSPQAVSEALCFRAKSVYDDQRAVASPFQQRAMEEGIHYAGGKIDDVSCLVGVVGELEAAPNRRDTT